MQPLFYLLNIRFCLPWNLSLSGCLPVRSYDFQKGAWQEPWASSDYRRQQCGLIRSFRRNGICGWLPIRRFSVPRRRWAPSARGSPNRGHLAHYPDGYCAGSWTMVPVAAPRPCWYDRPSTDLTGNESVQGWSGNTFYHIFVSYFLGSILFPPFFFIYLWISMKLWFI